MSRSSRSRSRWKPYRAACARCSTRRSNLAPGRPSLRRLRNGCARPSRRSGIETEAERRAKLRDEKSRGGVQRAARRLQSTSARERRVLEGVFAEHSRASLSLWGEELDADHYRGERAREVSPDRVNHLSRRAVDRRVVHACPLLAVGEEDDIDALHVAKVR